METDFVLGQLIEKFLEPIKGREAQIELTRFMTRHLGLGPDSVRGFPTIMKVRDRIRIELANRLLEATQPVAGEEVTYFKRGMDWGWEPGKKMRVVSVCFRHTGLITLTDGNKSRAVCALYCQELLERVGADVNFVSLSEKAKALRK